MNSYVLRTEFKNPIRTKMMLKKKIRNISWWRWCSIVVMGVSVRLFSDFMYSLYYRQSITFEFKDYFSAILLAFMILEGIRLVDHQLDRLITWEKHHTKRFLIQLVSNGVVTMVMLIIFAFFLQNLINENPKRPLFEDVVIVSATISVTIALVAIDLFIFFLKRWRNSMSEVERFKKESLECGENTLS